MKPLRIRIMLTVPCESLVVVSGVAGQSPPLMVSGTPSITWVATGAASP